MNLEVEKQFVITKLFLSVKSEKNIIETVKRKDSRKNQNNERLLRDKATFS